jgi:hypothetical protein
MLDSNPELQERQGQCHSPDGLKEDSVLGIAVLHFLRFQRLASLDSTKKLGLKVPLRKLAKRK